MTDSKNLNEQLASLSPRWSSIFSSFEQVSDGRWQFVVPITHVFLTETVNQEIQIDRVLFVDAKKFRRIRKRLRIKSRVSELNDLCRPQLDGATAYAILFCHGKPQELYEECLQCVRDELNILASSLLGWARSRICAHLGLRGELHDTSAHCLFLNTNDERCAARQVSTSGELSLITDGAWKEWKETFFFGQLLKILQKRVAVAEHWRECLRRATVLIGKSVRCSDSSMAFLWNMIALEMLLTRQGDKYADALPERVEAFLGWADFWQTQDFEEKIRKCYSVRCQIVHDGDPSELTRELLVFSDKLLLSVLVNLTRHTRLFRSRDDVVNFSERVKAERLLRVKPKVRPKQLIGFPIHHNRSPIDEI
jgi:hypothetical protein